MSHFTVLVIGDNPEKQLEPFSENLDVPAYVAEVVSEEDKDHFTLIYTTFDPTRTYAQITEAEALENDSKSFDELYAEYGEDWNSNEWEKRDDVWIRVSTYNPDAKWDWYVLGGRWDGFLKVGRSKVNFALKSQIDFEGKSKEAAKEARRKYRHIKSLFNGNIPKIEMSWESIEGEDIAIRRTKYWNQPSIIAWHEGIKKSNEEWPKWAVQSDFQCSEEEYAKIAYDSANVTFAVLKDGEWYEKGSMGWCGNVSDPKEESDWNTEFNNLISELPEDVRLSVYDCHI